MRTIDWIKQAGKQYIEELPDCPNASLLKGDSHLLKPWDSQGFVRIRDELLQKTLSRDDLLLVVHDDSVTSRESLHVAWPRISNQTWQVSGRPIDAQVFEYLRANAEWTIYRCKKGEVLDPAMIRRAVGLEGAELCRTLVAMNVEFLLDPVGGNNELLLWEV